MSVVLKTCRDIFGQGWYPGIQPRTFEPKDPQERLRWLRGSERLRARKVAAARLRQAVLASEQMAEEATRRIGEAWARGMGAGDSLQRF